MRVNLIVEDFGAFKYLGCATAAKNLYKSLSKIIDVNWNNKSSDFDIAHFHTFGPSSLNYLKRFEGKKILTAHSTPYLNKGNISFTSFINKLYKPIYNMFDHIIAVSNKCKNELVDIGIQKEISPIYNGIDCKRFIPNKLKRQRFRNLLGIKTNDLVILTVAQRTPRKGIYDFLQLAQNLPYFKFIWIGGFPYSVLSKDYLKIRKAIERKTENTFFPGFIKDIEEAYSAADVFFMPSYAEGHSIVMLEALSMGLPIVARDIEEFREAFNNNLIYFNKRVDEN